MGKIQLTGADNARDLGGIRTADGAVIRKGVSDPEQPAFQNYKKRYPDSQGSVPPAQDH